MASGYILYLQWEAMIISYLSARVITLPFDSLADLLDNTNYKIQVFPGSILEDHWKTSNDPLSQRAWVERIQPYLEEYKLYSGTLLLQE